MNSNTNNSSPESTASYEVEARLFLNINIINNNTEDNNIINNNNDNNNVIPDLVLHNNIPFKVISTRLRISRHAKFVEFTCREYFNPQKVEVFKYTVASRMQVPIVTITTYQLVDIDQNSDKSDDNSYLSLLDMNGEIRDDLKCPQDEELTNELIHLFNLGKDLEINVAKVMDLEGVISFNYEK